MSVLLLDVNVNGPSRWLVDSGSVLKRKTKLWTVDVIKARRSVTVWLG